MGPRIRNTDTDKDRSNHVSNDVYNEEDIKDRKDIKDRNLYRKDINMNNNERDNENDDEKDNENDNVDYNTIYLSPHLYTYDHGDTLLSHDGARCWFPCFD